MLTSASNKKTLMKRFPNEFGMTNKKRIKDNNETLYFSYNKK